MLMADPVLEAIIFTIGLYTYKFLSGNNKLVYARPRHQEPCGSGEVSIVVAIQRLSCLESSHVNVYACRQIRRRHLDNLITVFVCHGIPPSDRRNSAGNLVWRSKR